MKRRRIIPNHSSFMKPFSPSLSLNSSRRRPPLLSPPPSPQPTSMPTHRRRYATSFNSHHHQLLTVSFSHDSFKWCRSLSQLMYFSLIITVSLVELTIFEARTSTFTWFYAVIFYCSSAIMRCCPFHTLAKWAESSVNLLRFHLMACAFLSLFLADWVWWDFVENVSGGRLVINRCHHMIVSSIAQPVRIQRGAATGECPCRRRRTGKRGGRQRKEFRKIENREMRVSWASMFLNF